VKLLRFLSIIVVSPLYLIFFWWDTSIKEKNTWLHLFYRRFSYLL